MNSARARTVVLAAALVACRHEEHTPPPPVAVAPSAIPEERDAGPPPLRADPPLAPLTIDGFEPAHVSIPQGATRALPIVVATHGLWDLPEGLCENWRWIVRDAAWVLCPRGSAMPDKTYRYKSATALVSEIDAGVRALVARFPGYVDDGPMLYTGFSHGAILGVFVIARAPSRFPYAILTEGGEDQWTQERIRAFASGGGKRVLFACGLRGRVPAAEQAAKALERAGVAARVVLGKLPDAGQFIHWYSGPVADEEKAQLPWLLDADARWSDVR